VTDVVGGELDIPTIANGGANSPLGASSNSASNLTLVGTGRPSTLMLTGVNSTYSTDRGLTDSGGAIGVQNAGTTLTWNGQITGGGSLTKTGGGVLVLTNTSNNYQSGTYVEEGTLQTPATPPSHGVSADQVLPYERNVTVAAGARWLVTNAVVGNGIWVGDVSLEGGELDVTGEAQLYVTSLVADTPGSVVNLTGSAQLIFWGTPATARINADTTWSGDSLYPFVFDRYGDPIELIVAPGATLTSSVFLSPIDVSSSPFHISGGGTVYITTRINNEPADYVVYQGRLRADNLSVASDGSSVLGLAQAGFLTLDGGTLQYSGPTATSPMPITVTSNGGTLEVSNAATTLTYTGTLSGFGPFIKNGPGVLILDNLANAYASGITVSGGRIDVSDDAQLGAAIVTVNPAGTLRYTADATTARTFNLTGGKLEAPAGVTLTLSGAAVNGGFIRGAGTFVVTGGATLSAATTLNGTTINQTGAASFTDFTNGGVLNLAAGLPDPVSLDGFTNQGSGVVTVGAGSQVNASDFQSYGVVTLNPGSAATPTLLTATGGSAIYLNGGSRTYIGSAASPDPLSATLSGNIELNGGLLVNNGTVSGTVDINFGGLAKGVGTYGVVNVSLGGVFSPGNSPGIVTATQVTIGSTATPSGAPTLLMELAGTTPGTLYDQLHVTGQLSLGGLLEITLAPGFNPTSGNRFDLLDWGSLSGHFDSLSLPALSAGLAWNTTQLYVTGVLAVTDINLLPGDFNRDHHVDASDIVPAIVSLTNPTVYEAQYGVNATDLSIIGDLNADGRFTNADMQSLLNLLLSGGGSTTPVPEPSAFVMSILAFGVAAAMKYRSEFGSLPLSTLRLPSLPYSHKR
jgi:fibronectin-binding autotransporter adhesin